MTPVITFHDKLVKRCVHHNDSTLLPYQTIHTRSTNSIRDIVQMFQLLAPNSRLTCKSHLKLSLKWSILIGILSFFITKFSISSQFEGGQSLVTTESQSDTIQIINHVNQYFGKTEHDFYQCHGNQV